MPATRKTAMKKASVKKAPKAANRPGRERWNLRLYVAGQYSIEIIDLLERPSLAKGDQILAIPTLVRKLPTPIKKIIGDLSDTERVLVGLDLRPAG